MKTEMAKLLALSNGQKMEDNVLHISRNKAYTFMKEAVDEIRRHGQYIFWKDEHRFKGYVSLYFKKHASRAPKPLNAEAENELVK